MLHLIFSIRFRFFQSFSKLVLSTLWTLTILAVIKTNLCESKRQNVEIDLNLLQKRCDLICYKKNPPQCIAEECVQESITKLRKPGTCPGRLPLIFEMPCIENCQFDYECPGTKKCCQQSSCEGMCQEAEGLLTVSTLASIPYNLTVTERKKSGRMCEISWYSSTDSATIFVVEARYHVGNVFAPHKLGQWQWYQYHKIAEIRSFGTSNYRTIAHIKLRSGRWYQFRVAAVNENGFRGYSNTSIEFKLSEPPKPPKTPKNLVVMPVRLQSNGSVYARASWSQPKSDLPIEKYKVYWALYLKADNHSLLLNEAYVKEPTRYYEFWNLIPNSAYYIQVQAISINGRKRLKSPKESMMLNTSLPLGTISSNKKTAFTLINATEYATKINLRSAARSRPHDIEIRFIVNKKLGMLVRILLNETYRDSLLELCTGVTDCKNGDNVAYGAVKLKKDHIDFIKLKFNTQYTVKLSDPNRIGENNIIKMKTFTTPTCENWIQKRPNIGITCP